MKIKMLKKGYRNNKALYMDFIEDRIDYNNDYFDEEILDINIESPDFPIYMGLHCDNKEKNNDFLEAFEKVSKYYIDINRDIHLDGLFWHSFLVSQKRDYIISKYPKIVEDQKIFNSIVFKKFDWENYIYKIIIGASYIKENVEVEDEQVRYFKLIIDNLDIYNYMLKYPIFRNGNFLLNILDIINDNDLSSKLKAKLEPKDRSSNNKKKDLRLGRMILFELNKAYPSILVQTLSKDELETIVIRYLNIVKDKYK